MTVALSDLVPDLVPALAPASVLATLLRSLQSGPFPTTTWNAGAVVPRLLNAEAANYADALSVVAAIAQGGYLSTSTGDWLTLLAREFFNVQRGPTETDDDLRARCLGRWSQGPASAPLGLSTSITYEAVAVEACPEVRQARAFESTPANGQVTIVLAGGIGGVSQAAVDTVKRAMDRVRPLCAAIDVQSALPIYLPVQATLYVKASQSSGARDAALLNLAVYNATLGIGAATYVSQIITALMAVPGAIEVDMPSLVPAVDQHLLPAHPMSVPVFLPTVNVLGLLPLPGM